MYLERFKYCVGTSIHMSSFPEYIDEIKKSKVVNREAIIKMALKERENLRYGIEEIENRYKITQRLATIAMIHYGAGVIYKKHHGKIEKIYELREKIRNTALDKPENPRSRTIARMMDSLTVYVNNLTNVKRLNVSLFRTDYDYLGGVARAVGSSVSSIVRLAMYISMLDEGMKIIENPVQEFEISLDAMLEILGVLSKFLE